MSIKRNLMVYGGGGAGKSTRMAELASYIFRTTGKRTRVINADGGGTESAFAHLIPNVVTMWHIDTWDNSSIFSLLDLATKGWWPGTLDVPNTPLLPPSKDWRPCPKCEGDTGGTSFGMVDKCKSCGERFGAGIVLPVVQTLLNGMDETGCYVFEGFTAFCALMLRALRNSDPGGGNTVNESGFKVAAPGLPHYGMAQSYIAQFVGNSRRIPVGMTAWTALEYTGEDETNKKIVFGPKGPGKAITVECIPWFTDVLHLDLVQKKDAKGVVQRNSDGQDLVERKLYLVDHVPSDNIAARFKAKTSAPPCMKTVISGENIMEEFFKELDVAYQKMKEGVK